MSCQEVSPPKRQTQALTSHHLIELEPESIRSEADDVEERAQMPSLWGWGIPYHCFSVPAQLFPKMSLGSVYILQSVGSLTAQRTTHRVRGSRRSRTSTSFLQHVLGTISCHFHNSGRNRLHDLVSQMSPPPLGSGREKHRQRENTGLLRGQAKPVLSKRAPCSASCVTGMAWLPFITFVVSWNKSLRSERCESRPSPLLPEWVL